MTAEDWKYIENTFLPATDGSFLKANAILIDHIAKLAEGAKTSLPIAQLVTEFAPTETKWNNAYRAWSDARALYRSRTDTFEGLIAELITRPPGAGARSILDGWVSKVNAVAAIGHPDYTYLFPRGREAFTLASRDELTTNLLNLALRLGARRDELASPASVPTAARELKDRHAAYVILAPQVADFHAKIKEARELQQGAEGSVTQLRAPLEAARLEVCDELYGNLGALMRIFRKNRPAVAGFFDLELLRTPTPEEEDPVAPPAIPPPAAPPTPPTPPTT